MIKFNTDAFNGFNENALVPCHYCGRTFLPDSLKIHRKICTADKPFKPLNRGKKAKAKPKAKHSWENKPVGGRRRKVEMVSEDEEDYQELVRQKHKQVRNQRLYKKKPTKRKVKNFYEDSDDDKEIINNYSYSRPKKGSHLGKKESNRNFNTNANANRKRPAKKLSKYGTQQQRRKNPRMRNEKPTYHFREPTPEPSSEPSPSPEPIRRRPQKPRKPQKRKKPKPKPAVTYNFSGPPANLEPCRYCGRSFAEDRIKKHITICRIQKNKKVKVKRFHKVITAKEKRKILRKKPKTNWKLKHQEFVKQMRYMRKLKKVEEEGGDIRDIAPPPPSVQPGLVPCKYCGRRFREQAHGRHEKICQNVFGGKKGPTRPKKTRQQRRRGY